ncbi:MAG: hypothetical protein ACYDD6_06495 [Acidimicrobiales bacterium]
MTMAGGGGGVLFGLGHCSTGGRTPRLSHLTAVAKTFTEERTA